MKKCLSLLLAAVMTLLCCSAFAESTTGRGDLVVRSESLSAYVDGDGNLWIPGNVLQFPAGSLQMCLLRKDEVQYHLENFL